MDQITNTEEQKFVPVYNPDWHSKTSAICAAVFLLTIVFSYFLVRLGNPVEFTDSFDLPKINPPGIDLHSVIKASKSFVVGSHKSSDYAVGHPPFEIFCLIPSLFCQSTLRL